MSRIIAGICGGTPLASVPGSATRPTTDRVKEALFSRLEALGMVARARVLDLYAGSGALGVEAVSRGASTAELVESDAKAVGVALYGPYLLAVELASMMLTAGLVAAYHLGKHD